VIDAILEEDKMRRQARHTAKRIFDRLREVHGFSCGYSIVKEYRWQLEPIIELTSERDMLC